MPYSGTYPGLTDEEIADREANGPWYAQKTQPANQWRADHAIATGAAVTFVDWGDNIESVNPKLRRPFRLEVTLYQALATPMQGYVMALLENPSSPDELQGTNGQQYDSQFATVISNSPKLAIQYLGISMPTDELTWDGSAWSQGTDVPVTFAPELNVGGKYIYGASQGGWKPTDQGFYRITFFVPAGGVSLESAVIGNYATFSMPAALEADEGGAATPVVRGDLNLTYVDVEVLGGGGGGKRR